MNKIALLLSGGVDSSVALHMLCKAGEKPDCYGYAGGHYFYP